MRGSYNRFMLQSVRSGKAYKSIVDKDKPGSSLDVPVENEAYKIIEAVTKLKKELSHLEHIELYPPARPCTAHDYVSFRRCLNCGWKGGV